jgi:hypothetical protein
MRVRSWVESNGAAHVHVTVSMSLAVLVEFSVEVVGQVREMGDSKCVKDESMPLRATLIVIQTTTKYVQVGPRNN